MTVVNKIISYIIVALVALQVLNLGLYAQDFDIIREDSCSYEPNIINSVTEYLAEIVMNKHNTFPEKKEKPNQKDHEVMYKFQPFKIYNAAQHQWLLSSLAEDRKYVGYLVQPYQNYTTDITSPPPKFSI